MRLELKQEQALRNAAKDELQRLEARKDKHLSELASELGSVNAINKRLESELERARGELLEGETAINNLKFELMEKDRAIATLQTELDNRLAEAAKNEIFLSEELQRFKYGIFPSEESHGEQLQLFPTPEEQAAVTPEPEPEEPENDTTEVLQAEAQTTEETEIVDSKGLLDYILKKAPKSGINYEKIRDAIRDKDKKAEGSEFSRLFNYEQAYGFTFLGKINNRYQFKIPKL